MKAGRNVVTRQLRQTIRAQEVGQQQLANDCWQVQHGNVSRDLVRVRLQSRLDGKKQPARVNQALSRARNEDGKFADEERIDHACKAAQPGTLIAEPFDIATLQEELSPAKRLRTLEPMDPSIKCSWYE